MRDYLAADTATLAQAASQLRLFESATGSLAGLRARFDSLGSLSDRLSKILPEGFEDQLTELQRRMTEFATPVTFVGQVKSGKTALVNMLAARPGLLPSDVNPWTSVVTTLHINTPRPRNVRAEFAFFDQTEWEDLIRDGGRLGTLAKRTHADQELAQIRAQIEDMYAKSRERLGRNFELLLGNRHKYDEFSQNLIERYVCLGDQYCANGEQPLQGRFADITRSADLYIEVPGYPVGLSFQDTPGVNDPFLMREQVTLRSMNNASICVVVLSAAQAMATVDLALIQLLCALESRRVVIFVNRIDELGDPARDIPEIRAALERTLHSRGIGDISNILFGSAHWAEAALAGGPDMLSPASLSALENLALADTAPPHSLFAERAWHFSGLGALQKVIGETIASTSGAGVIDDSWRRMTNLVATIRSRHQACSGTTASQLSEEQTKARTSNLRRAVEAYIEQDMTALLDGLSARIRQNSQEYVERMARDLVVRARENGRGGVENCDPMHLRMRLRTAYIRYSNEMRSFFQDISDGTCQAMIDLYAQMLGEAAADMQLQPPAAPAPAPPVALGRTIVVDLQTTRWKAWMASHINSKGLEREYHSLVEAEVNSICEELTATARDTLTAMARILRNFLDEQEAMALAIARGGSLAPDSAGNPPAANPVTSRSQALDQLSQDLRQFAGQCSI